MALTEKEIDHLCAKLLALLYVYGSEEFVVQKPLQKLCMGCAGLFNLQGGETPDSDKVRLFKMYLVDLAKDKNNPVTFSNCLDIADVLKIEWVREISDKFNVFSWTKNNKNRRKSKSMSKVRQAKTKEM